MNKKIIIIITGIIVLLIVVSFLVQSNKTKNIQASINSFEECAEAGNPIMESYPEQCRTADGRLFVRDISGDNQATSTPTNSAEGAPKGSIHNLPVPEGVNAARKALAQNVKVAENSIVIMTAFEKEWSDSCLGLAGPDEMCAAVITPGFEVTMQAQGKTYVYRTNTSGTVVRAN
ncbi:MAG: hypothetical protein M3Q73_04130 [bacterium]|nr:hypothetical protein [bacterium]